MVYDGSDMSRKRRNILNDQQRNELINKLITNATGIMTSRRELAQKLGKQFNGQRDLYEVLGYKKDPTFADYEAAYERGDIAQRIVDAPPTSTWRRKPVISNDENPTEFTEFETQWAKLVQKRRIFHYLERADKLAGIGEYGVLFLGTADIRNEKDLERPMGKLRGPEGLLYLAPFTQDSAAIESTVTDPRSERFGLPEMYTITMSDTGSLSKLSQVRVHASRVIHIAEGLRENDILGTPRLKPVFNRLYDIDKIAGGSAEVFWQVAKRIMVLEAKEGFGAVDEDDALTQMMDEVIHGLRRVIDLQGYEAKVLENSDVHPDEAFRVALALISGTTGIPQRILIGSEQGKMASTQDEINWNGRIADRQLNFAEPTILRPFIDKLIFAGILPAPDKEYVVTWPSLFEQSDKEKATIGLLKARALKAYTGKMGEDLGPNSQIVPPEEFRTEILNLRGQKVEISETGGQVDGPKAKPPKPAPAPPKVEE